ncbi:glucans biosynthesis glucosyltransferase MdoH [Halioxenophilus sp. WMMB6]|uniref:glucans biosynthesis glucosyltransferase MdoH n=1 Tax=Halioxenophilus sp. WMMB6 TaxID=3073815 RepID=UPI00295E85E7|nr:glucans biosynthesis glucosyltransferase MdoH [Halioxenophilus sp. WMMB6]
MRSLAKIEGDPNTREFSYPAQSWRLVIFFLVNLVSIVAGGAMMFDILSANETTVFELVLLGLFIITYGWICIAFWTGVVGFFFQWFRRDPLTLAKLAPESNVPADLNGFRTAVIMPIYNEDVERVFAGFEASIQSLLATGHGSGFDFYLLSDSQKPLIKEAELKAWRALQERLGAFAQHTYYRNRTQNSYRKVGNVAEFCQRWGRYYQAMIVLDADSVMTGSCMVELSAKLKSNPDVGLIQTVPIPVRQSTFFGRFLQFAASLCSPMLATGLAFWQTDNANYWGHNAIIRVTAFVAACGLPKLPGKAPFGGEILSHDFVEAALLRRAGWQVVLDANQGGSYEEVPGNMLDYATRDRRWLQGNIQHLGLLTMSGVSLLSRLHFLLGALAYLSSFIWLMMLLLSSLDAVARALVSDQFFTSSYQLFPVWPIAKTDVIAGLMAITSCLLFAPKIMALILAWRNHPNLFGGRLRLMLSAVIEIVFAVAIAPVMMFFHTVFLLSTLSGVDSPWQAQPREGRLVSWRDAFRRTWLASVMAIVWAGLTAHFTISYFYWLLPVIVGMFLAAPIVRWSSSVWLGRWLREQGLLVCPAEAEEPVELQVIPEGIARVAADLNSSQSYDNSLPTLLPDLSYTMPQQALFQPNWFSRRYRAAAARTSS